MSKEELKKKLRRQAIINAIENEFGTHVSQETFVDIEDGSPEFRIIGSTTIRGEWLKTTGEEFTEEIKTVKRGNKAEHEIWITCVISGKVREILKPSIDFTFDTGNCPTADCSTTIFNNGESLYLHFNTPVNGYLTVFVEEGDHAYRILPYQQMGDAYPDAVPVEADKPYVFFSNFREHDYFLDFSYALADELLMLTDKKEEYVTMYIVYSIKEFTKPAIGTEFKMEAGLGVPKSLPISNFQEWLEDNRIHSTDFYYRSVTMKIVNRAYKP
jgi:hypothetical protein